MSLVFDIQKIQDLELGWEQEWGKIYINLLYSPTGEDGPLFQFAKYHFCSSEAEENTRVDEFVDFMSKVFLQRIKKQNLFSTYDPEKGNVLAFLCERKFLEVYCRQFKKQCFPTFTAVYSEASDSSDEESSGPFNIADPRLLTPDKEIYKQKIRKLFDALQDNIVVHFSKSQITREYIYAGLQFYPRLSQTDKATKNLYDHVSIRVSDVHLTEDANALILEYYEQDSAEIREEMDKCRKRIDDMRYHKGSKSYLNDCDRYFLNFKKLYLYPLKNASIVFLLKMNNRNVVDKWHGDYIAALPVILQNYKKIYDNIQNEEY